MILFEIIFIEVKIYFSNSLFNLMVKLCFMHNKFFKVHHLIEMHSDLNELKIIENWGIKYFNAYY